MFKVNIIYMNLENSKYSYLCGRDMSNSVVFYSQCVTKKKLRKN